jgi:hypothetical protein
VQLSAIKEPDSRMSSGEPETGEMGESPAKGEDASREDASKEDASSRHPTADLGYGEFPGGIGIPGTETKRGSHHSAIQEKKGDVSRHLYHGRVSESGKKVEAESSR